MYNMCKKGSKGLKIKILLNKNKPLFLHTLNFAKKVNFIDHKLYQLILRKLKKSR